ncbi:MAG: molecular chaperone GrpE (heat shock protein) [Myxococcota bacterium]
MEDLDRRLAQIGKAVVQINLRLGRVLTAVEGGSSGGAPDMLEPLFDLIDAVDRVAASLEQPPPPPPWWAPWQRPPAAPSGVLDGLQLARQRAIDQLRAGGIEPAPREGPCDPHQHQVLDTVATPHADLGHTIHTTHRRGWIRRGETPEVLRTALVTAWTTSP